MNCISDTFDSFGVTMWIKPKPLNGRRQVLLDCNKFGVQKKYLKIDLTPSGRLQVRVTNGDDSGAVDKRFASLEQFPVRAGEWNYVGFTFDGEYCIIK